MLLANVIDYGKRMQAAKPSEIVIGNVVKHILYIIREEYSTFKFEETQKMMPSPRTSEVPKSPAITSLAKSRNTTKLNQSGMLGWLEEDDMPDGIQDEVHNNLKLIIIEGVDDWLSGIENLYLQVSDEAIQHIHSNEIIMTVGRSRTVEFFLKKAASARKFQVFVTEAAPSYSGREMAKALATGRDAIDTTLIADAAIFSLMSRVNKVIIGTHGVMANGGLLAQAGTHLVAQAAKYHKVPVIVCCGLYKLCPVFPSNLDLLQELRSPTEVLKFEEVLGPMESVTVENPSWDYIPPDLVDLYITNGGGYNPTYLYRLLAELYHPKDRTVF